MISVTERHLAILTFTIQCIHSTVNKPTIDSAIVKHAQNYTAPLKTVTALNTTLLSMNKLHSEVLS